MTQESLRSTSPPPPDAPPGAAAPTSNPYDQFREHPIVEYLLSHGGHSQVRYDRDVEPGAGTISQFRVQQQYAVSDEEHAAAPITLRLTLLRSRVDGRLKWIVVDYQSDDL